MDLCMAPEKRPGPWVSKQWWEQDGVDVWGGGEATQEADRAEGEEDIY